MARRRASRPAPAATARRETAPLRVVRTARFQESYQGLSAGLRALVERKIALLQENQAHPSLRVHRLRRAQAAHVWEAYVSVNKRLVYRYLQAERTLYLYEVGEHSVTDRIHARRFGGQHEQLRRKE